MKVTVSQLLVGLLCVCLTSASSAAQQNTTDALLNVARSYAASGNIDGAITEYYRFVFLFPESDQKLSAYLELGIACREANQPESCIRAFGNAMELATSNEDRARIRIELADAYLVFD